jgi:periplasmic divalent cation tolerance protein
VGSVKGNSLIILYVVFPKKFKLKEMISGLLKKNIVVCANVISGMQSYYMWKGKAEKAEETVVLFKTLAKFESLAKKEIEKNHPYDVPFIAVLTPKSVNAGYLKYAVEQQISRIK